MYFKTAFAAILCLAGCEDTTCETGEIMAAVMSTHFVEAQLRSPSTAEFQAARNAKVMKMKPCEFRVLSYVDAQNGFGGIVRTNYSILMTYNPKTEGWLGSDLSMQ